MIFSLADFKPFLRFIVNLSRVILLTDKLEEALYLLANLALCFFLSLLKSSSAGRNFPAALFKVRHVGFAFITRYYHRRIEPCSRVILKLHVRVIGAIFFTILRFD